MSKALGLADLDLEDRPFLHEQGQYVGRGFTVDLSMNDGQWTLRLRNIERLKNSEEIWVPDNVFDEFSGPLDRTTVRGSPEGFITISGYGSETILGPRVVAPWLELDWPELDGFSGGPMDLHRLSKRERKKLLNKLRRRK